MMPDAHNLITGTVTEYFPDRGFGFITTVDIEDGESTDVFFHISEVYEKSEVEEGWRLECSPRYNPKEGGWEANGARVISKGQDDDLSEGTRQPWYRRSDNQELDESMDAPDKVRAEMIDGDSSESSPTREEGSSLYEQSDHI